MSRLHIIMYHYVREIKNSKYPEIKGLEYKLFLEQLDFLQKEFQFISMEDVIETVSGRASLPERAVLLTFDDGYKDHYEFVYPELKRRGISGAFFMPARVMKESTVLDVNKIHFILATRDIKELVSEIFRKLDEARKNGMEILSNEELYRKLAVANRWDSAETIFVKRLFQNELPENFRNKLVADLFEESVGVGESEFSKQLYLSEKEALDMKKDGMYFGLHGYEHYWLGKLSEEKQREDISKSLAYVNEIGLVPKENWVMNYPYGSYSDETIEIARSLGAVAGLGVTAKTADLAVDHVMALPRYDTNDFPPKSTNYRKCIE